MKPFFSAICASIFSLATNISSSKFKHRTWRERGPGLWFSFLKCTGFDVSFSRANPPFARKWGANAAISCADARLAFDNQSGSGGIQIPRVDRLYARSPDDANG